MSCNRTQDIRPSERWRVTLQICYIYSFRTKSTSRQLDIAQLDQEWKYERRDQKATSISTLSDKEKDFHQSSEWVGRETISNGLS